MVVMFLGAWLSFGAFFYFVSYRYLTDRYARDADARWDEGM